MTYTYKYYYYFRISTNKEERKVGGIENFIPEEKPLTLSVNGTEILRYEAALVAHISLLHAIIYLSLSLSLSKKPLLLLNEKTGNLS